MDYIRYRIDGLSDADVSIALWSLSRDFEIGNLNVNRQRLLDIIKDIHSKNINFIDDIFFTSTVDDKRVFKLILERNIAIYTDNKVSYDDNKGYGYVYPNDIIMYYLTHDIVIPNLPPNFGFYKFNDIKHLIPNNYRNTTIRNSGNYDITKFYSPLIHKLGFTEVYQLRKYVRDTYLNGDMGRYSPPPLKNGIYIKTQNNRLIYQIDEYTIATPPLGLEGVWPHHYVIAYQDISIEIYNIYWNFLYGELNKPHSDLEEFTRALMYYLANTPNIPSIKVTDKLDLSLEEVMLEYIINMPYILNHIAIQLGLFPDGILSDTVNRIRIIKDKIIDDYTPKINIGHNIFQLQKLKLYLADHPEIKVREKTVDEIPHYIEDYIDFSVFPEYMIKLLDDKFPQISENPFDNIEGDLIGVINREYKVMENFANRVGGKWLQNNYSRNVFYDSHTNFDTYFLLALMGLKPTIASGSLSINNLFFIADVINLGGLGFNSSDANSELKYILPIYDNFFVGNNLKTIAELFKIPTYNTKRKDMKILFSRGYIHPLVNMPPELQPAADKWAYTTEVQRAIYSNEFNFNEAYDVYVKERYSPKYLLYYEYIESYTPITAEVIANKLQLLIPPNISIDQYFIKNSLSIERYITRKKKPDIQLSTATFNNLAELSDREIYDVYEAFIGHESRKQLRQYIKIGTPEVDDIRLFFVPFFRHPQNQRFITYFDTDDYDYSPLNPENFAIAYGYFNEYKLYLVGELIAGFLPSGEFNDVRAMQIIAGNGTQSEAQPLNKIECLQLKQLAQFLLKFSVSNVTPDELNHLIREIDITIHAVEYAGVYNIEVKTQFRILNEEDKALLFKAFALLFDIGMYYRHWKGPGYPYPLTYSETLSANVFTTGEEAAFPAMIIFKDLYESLSPEASNFLNNLHIVNHKNGTIEQSAETTFKFFWDKLRGVEVLSRFENLTQDEKAKEVLSRLTGDYCIRMASTIMVGTGHYYAFLLYAALLGANEVGGYNPTKIIEVM